ncbi:hypothetical protein EBT31_14880, partial [bacterium]|nr:hypothetical protein [bacterium]
MARTIEFDVERLLGRLNVLEGTQIKYAAKRTLGRFAFEVRKRVIQEMSTNFNNPVPFTLKAPRPTEKEGYKTVIEEPNAVSVRLFIDPNSGSKGNSPASYLYPTDRSSPGSEAYATRFARGLSKTNVTSKFPVPYKRGIKVRRNSYGNMMPSQYDTVLKAVQKPGSSIFALPNGNPSVGYSGSSKGNRRVLPPGIYAREGRTAFLLFALLDEPPNVSENFSFFGTAQQMSTSVL